MPVLLVQHGGTIRGAQLPRRLLIGRRAMNQLVVDHPAVSRMHAWIEWKNGGYTLTDTGSRTGTHLNDEFILAEQPLKDGDLIRVGPATITFLAAEQVPADIAEFELPPEPAYGADDRGVLFDCAGCGAPLWASNAFVGKGGECRYCGFNQTVPTAGAALRAARERRAKQGPARPATPSPRADDANWLESAPWLELPGDKSGPPAPPTPPELTAVAPPATPESHLVEPAAAHREHVVDGAQNPRTSDRFDGHASSKGNGATASRGHAEGNGHAHGNGSGNGHYGVLATDTPVASAPFDRDAATAVLEAPTESLAVRRFVRGEPICGVCQSPITVFEEKHCCPSCNLDFHAECWTENYGCSAYGCSQVNALAPAAEPAADDHTTHAATVDESVHAEPHKFPWEFALLAASVVAAIASAFSFGTPSLIVAIVAATSLVRTRGQQRHGGALALATFLGVIGAGGGAVVSYILYITGGVW